MSRTDDRPRPGELLRQLRELRGFSSVRLAASRIGLSHTRLGELEDAPGAISMRTSTAERIARAYAVPVSLIHRIASGRLDALPNDFGNSSEQTGYPNQGGERNRGRIHPVRFLGSVSAGMNGDGVLQPIDYLSVADFFIGKYKPEELYALEVTGDSMVSEDLRASTPPGSIILVHESLAPQPGRVVVAWLERQEIGVLKVYKEDQGKVWLVSHNSEHPPIQIDEDTPATIRGVMVSQWTKAPGI